MSEVRPLPEPLAKKAAIELNETPENVAHKLQALREWAQAQNHIRSRTNDQFLIAFLRGAKFSLERAKHKLENYYVYRSKMPKLFYGRNPIDPKVHTILQLRCLLYIPEPVAPDGPSIAMIRPNYFDLNKHTVEEVFMVGGMITDILLLEDDNAIVAGYIVIIDLKNVSAQVMLHFNPTFVRQLIILANKASPTRLKSCHFLNVPSMFTKAYNMAKSAINVKLRDRMHLHDGNIETLYEYVPRRILTKEYGGELDDTDWPDYWWQRFQEKATFLKEEESYGAVGSTQKSIDDFYDSEFGVEGSFRKLDFD